MNYLDDGVARASPDADRFQLNTATTFSRGRTETGTYKGGSWWVFATHTLVAKKQKNRREPPAFVCVATSRGARCTLS